MESFLQITALSLVLGGIYSLIALGLALIYSVMNIVNFAQGEIYMFGGFAMALIAQKAGVPYLVALLGTIAIIAALGFGIFYGLIAPVYRGKVQKRTEYMLVTTFALALFLQLAAIVVFGAQPIPVASAIDLVVHLGTGLTISGAEIFAVVAAVLLAGVVAWVLKYTWVGRSWRAIAQEETAARVVGVPVLRMSALAFSVGAVLSGVGGALIAPITLAFPTVGALALVRGFIAVVIGGLGSLRGAVVGGMIVGLSEGLGSFYFSSSYRTFYPLLAAAVVLAVRPRGLFPAPERVA